MYIIKNIYTLERTALIRKTYHHQLHINIRSMSNFLTTTIHLFDSTFIVLCIPTVNFFLHLMNVF